MNADEIAALIRQFIPILGAGAVTSGYVTGDQLVAIAGAVATIFSVGWTVYANWNQRKVHETAVVTSLAPTVAAAKDASIKEGK
jgi:hypothetical protein